MKKSGTNKVVCLFCWFRFIYAVEGESLVVQPTLYVAP